MLNCSHWCWSKTRMSESQENIQRRPFSTVYKLFVVVFFRQCSQYFLDWTNSFWSNYIKNFRSKWDVRNTKGITNQYGERVFHKTLTRWYKAEGEAFVENGFRLSTGEGEPCPLQIQNYLEWNEVFWGKYIFEIDYIISIHLFSLHQHWLAIMKVGKNLQHQKHLRNWYEKSWELSLRQQNIFSSCSKWAQVQISITFKCHVMQSIFGK